MENNRQSTTNAIIRKLQWLDDQELVFANELIRQILLSERVKENG